MSRSKRKTVKIDKIRAANPTKKSNIRKLAKFKIDWSKYSKQLNSIKTEKKSNRFLDKFYLIFSIKSVTL
jgi:hypothetical protein